MVLAPLVGTLDSVTPSHNIPVEINPEKQVENEDSRQSKRNLTRMLCQELGHAKSIVGFLIYHFCFISKDKR